MTEIIGAYGGYRRTLSFGFACLVYHATEVFCERNYSYKNDALGKTVGQMMGAARSARQNIVEGSSRAGTSKETELRLYDVAKGSLEELAKRFGGEGAADRVIFGDRPSLLRELVSAARETLRDWVYLAVRPRGWPEMPVAPVRRLVQRVSHWKGCRGA